MPTGSPAVWCSMTPAGVSWELLLPVSQQPSWGLDPKHAQMRADKFGKCWIGAKYKLFFLYIHPHIEVQQNQPAFVCMYFRLL